MPSLPAGENRGDSAADRAEGTAPSAADYADTRLVCVSNEGSDRRAFK
jgi:hypothetical protein